MEYEPFNLPETVSEIADHARKQVFQIEEMRSSDQIVLDEKNKLFYNNNHILRQKIWKAVVMKERKLRKEGKKTAWHGPDVIINGKRVTAANSINNTVSLGICCP